MKKVIEHAHEVVKSGKFKPACISVDLLERHDDRIDVHGDIKQQKLRQRESQHPYDKDSLFLVSGSHGVAADLAGRYRPLVPFDREGVEPVFYGIHTVQNKISNFSEHLFPLIARKRFS